MLALVRFGSAARLANRCQDIYVPAVVEWRKGTFQWKEKILLHMLQVHSKCSFFCLILFDIVCCFFFFWFLQLMCYGLLQHQQLTVLVIN